MRGRIREDVVDDRTLLERVRAELGRATRHVRALDVDVQDGAVKLSGPVLALEREAILAAAAGVRGVCEVLDALEVHETADGVPPLQGGSEDLAGAPENTEGLPS